MVRPRSLWFVLSLLGALLLILGCSSFASPGRQLARIARGPNSYELWPPPFPSPPHMARLWMSGNELADSFGGRGELGGEQNTGANTTFVHGGDYSYEMSTAGASVTSWFFNVSELYCRAYVYIPDPVTTQFRLFTLLDGDGTGTILVTAELRTDGTIEVWNRSPAVDVLVGTSTTALQQDRWHRIELHYRVSATVGLAELRIDGNTEVSASCNDASARNVHSVVFGPNDVNPGTWTYWDDLAINDTTGSSNNSWCGEGFIVGIWPSADTATIQWTPSTAGTHFSLIDDMKNDGPLNNADFIQTTSNTNGFEDRWGFDDLPATVRDDAEIKCILAGVIGGGDGTTTRTARFRGRDGSGNTRDGSNIDWNLNGFKSVYPIFTAEQTWEGSPAPLTKAYINGFQGAAVETNTNTRLIKWSMVWAMVEYLNPEPVMQAMRGFFTPIDVND